ncbi:hypothetical protein INR49_003877 [Caranx melampygus]|nr:hypothetical protein INR49_003877 [Caranx melampygus]
MKSQKVRRRGCKGLWGGVGHLPVNLPLLHVSTRLIGPPGDVDQDQPSNQDAQKEDMQYGSTELDAKGFILN